MMYGYIPSVDTWKTTSQDYVEFTVKKIRADILSLLGLTEKGTPEQKNELRTALNCSS